MTVGELKDKINAELQTPADMQKLIAYGK